MLPVRVKTSKAIYTAPEGMTKEQVGDLPYWEGIGGFPAQDLKFFYSAWRPQPEELDYLNKGGVVILGISAERHPVVSMGTALAPDPRAEII